MYGTVLVAVDIAHGEAGRRLIAIGRAIGGPEARLTALHVLDPVPGFVAAQIPEAVIEANRRDLLTAFQALVAEADPHARAELRQGGAAQSILMTAEEIRADLILVASHRPGPADYLMGSTAARVVRHAGCSVLVDRSAR